jgi:serine/threonine-protein kinase
VSQELKEFGRLTVERVLDLIEDVAAVFSRQEQLGILHRDIKPANLFMRPDGSTCVFDYGLVGFVNSAQAETSSGDVATKAGAMIGTMAYMAPEQVLSQETGPWTDIFALGLTAWEALTGHRPPSRSHSKTDRLMNAVAQDPIPSPRTVRPEVPAPVERLIEAMVSLDRESRYRSAADLYSDLCNFRYRGRRIQGAAKGRAFVAMPFQRNFNPVWSQIEEHASIRDCDRRESIVWCRSRTFGLKSPRRLLRAPC